MLKTKEDLISLFQEYKDLIYRYIFLRVGFNKEIAEDLAQDVFIKAWEKRNQFDQNRASLKTWLFAIARHHVLDYYRKTKFENINEEHEDKLGFVDDTEKRSLINFILKKVEQLNNVEQDIIFYKYIYEFDEKEISVIIKKSYGATRVLVSRAIKKLKIIING